MQRFILLSLVLFVFCFTGCSKRQAPSTLTIHQHDDGYHFIDHDDQVVHTSKSIDDLKLTIRKPAIRKLVVGSRVVIRFEGLQNEGGLTVPQELAPVLGALAEAGISRQDFDYTND